MKRICVDWDSTLVEEVWPEMGDWLPGAVDALKELASIYDEVVIFTLRVAPVDVDETTPRDPLDQIMAINLMLSKAEIPNNVYVWTKPYKPPAEFWIDDRAIRFTGDWSSVMDRLTRYRPEVKYDTSKIENPHHRRIAEMLNDMGNGKQVRTFETGATRDTDEGKPSYVSYLSPLVLKSYGEYMLEHELQSNGERREPGNWKKGMPLQAFLESHFRHLMDLWLIHDGYEGEAREPIKQALNAMLFNTFGYLHQVLEDDLC